MRDQVEALYDTWLRAWFDKDAFRGTAFKEDHRCTVMVINTRGESGWQVRYEHSSAIEPRPSEHDE